MNFCSLYSGSSGNSIFVGSEKAKILIDAGLSLIHIFKIFLPILSLPSTIATSIPKSLAVIAAINPEAPPPTIIKS